MERQKEEKKNKLSVYIIYTMGEEVKTKFNNNLKELKQFIDYFNTRRKFNQVSDEEGTINSKNQMTYEGEENKEGLPHGFGRMELKDGSKYEGTFFNGVAQGLGKYNNIVEGTYIIGEFQNGEPNGSVVEEDYGSEYKYEGDVLSTKYGEYVITKRFGYGTTLKYGIQYTGEFKGAESGITHVVFGDKSTFDGWFALSTYLGFGIRTYKNGDVYKGFFLRGKPRYMGVYTKKSGGGPKLIENVKGDNIPDDGVQNDDMEKMIDDAIRELMDETKLNEVQMKAKAAVDKAKAAAEKAKAAVDRAKTPKWGMKEYGLASAAVGLGAAGLYYALSKSKSKSKRRRKSRSKSKRGSKSKSRSKRKSSE